MTKRQKTNANSFYGNFEMGFLLKVHKIKEKVFLPLIKVLTFCKINAHIISFISALVTIITFYYSIELMNPLYFVLGIWIHMILDGIDGTLARYQKKDSTTGALIDVIGDQFGITLMCFFAYFFNYVNVINISVFFVLYLIVLLISLYLMFNKARYEIVIRPRIFFYIAVTWDFFIFINLTEVVVFISNIFLLASVLIGLFHLKELTKKRSH